MLAPPESFQVPREGSVLTGDHWPGQGPTLVLLHAGVCDRRSWNSVVPLLRAAGTVITYDRRGFGDSPPSTTTFSHLDDLLAVLDAVTTGPVWLIGSSMGGGLALDAALTAPERVAGLVLLAPGVSGAPEPEELDPATQRLSDALHAATDAGDLDLVNQIEVQVWLDGPAAAVHRVNGSARDIALAMNRIVVQHAVAEDAGGSGVNAWSRLGEIGAPTTVACGDLDVSYLLEQCEQLLTRIPGARRVTLPGTAHLPYLERPDLVADAIISAL